MLELVKKTILVGAGLTLLTADKMKHLVETFIREGEMTEKEAREAISELMDKSERALKSMEDKKKRFLNDTFSFWLYGVLSDEIEERAEKITTSFLQRHHVPLREELEEIRARIERLEQNTRDLRPRPE